MRRKEAGGAAGAGPLPKESGRRQLQPGEGGVGRADGARHRKHAAGPALRLVTLQAAAKLAREARQLGKASDILDKIGESYDINVGPIKADMVQDWADELNKDWAGGGGGAKGAKQRLLQAASRDLLDFCRRVTDDAINKGDVDTALRVLKLAQPAAGRLHDAKTKSLIQSSIKDVEKLKDQKVEVQIAIIALRDKPDDPETNATAGHWYCLVTGEWQKGLPYLAKGSDAEMAEAAKQDLAAPEKSAGQVTAGNLWWSLAEKKPVLEATRLKNRRRALVCLGAAAVVRSAGNQGPQAAGQPGREHRPICPGVRRPHQLRALPQPRLHRRHPHHHRSRGQERGRGQQRPLHLDRQRRSHRDQSRPRRRQLVLPRRCDHQRPRKRPQRDG